MPKTYFQRFVLLTFLFFYSIILLAQQPKVYKVAPIRGRVLGVNLENVDSATVTDLRTAEKTATDANGIYQLKVAKGDTIVFTVAKYSVTTKIVKSTKRNLNVIMIKLKTSDLPLGYSKSDYEKAEREDKKLIDILEKDARLDDKWNY